MIDLTGKVAVVTGGGSGIGRAICRTLARAGAEVAVSDLNTAGARETVRLVEGDGGQAVAFTVDIADGDAVARLCNDVGTRFGPPGIVVNNAGWDQIMPFMETDRPFWEKVVAINYLGPVGITHAFLHDMIERGEGGRVVNIASDAGRVGSLGETVYAGAKGAIIAFTKSLARETARYGISVNCVCPGPTDTPLLAQQPEKVRNALIRAIPYGRLARPEEIAAPVAFFASEVAGYMTGQVVSVSGGLTMAG